MATTEQATTQYWCTGCQQHFTGRFCDKCDGRGRPLPQPPAPEPTDARLAEIRARLDKAQVTLSDLCHGRQRFTMSVPARPESDPDLVIGSALHDAEHTLAAWERAGELLRAADERVADLLARVEADAATIAGAEACQNAVYDALAPLVPPEQRDGNVIHLARSVAATIAALLEKADAYDRINTPEIAHFLSAVQNEALHQRERWGVDEDGGKTDADWFWLVGYLAGKALHDVKGKRLHHIITAGAALLNWHAHAMGAYARMRPGIENPDAAMRAGEGR